MMGIVSDNPNVNPCRTLLGRSLLSDKGIPIADTEVLCTCRVGC